MGGPNNKLWSRGQTRLRARNGHQVHMFSGLIGEGRRVESGCGSALVPEVITLH